MEGKIIVYSKKPRRTKTSEIVEIGGHHFFLYCSDTMTRGNCEAYMATEPFLLVKVAYSNNEAREWIEENIDRVRQKIAISDSFDTVTREEWVRCHQKTAKRQQKTAYENEASEDSSCLTGC